jgi:hypothetical protein
MSVQRKDDRHSNDPVTAIKSLFDEPDKAIKAEEDSGESKRPQMRIVGDLRHSDKKRR